MKYAGHAIIIRRGLLVIGTTVLMAFVSMEMAESLFSSYYREQWGISARIMHSPPLGTNYTDKLAIVSAWAMWIGIILGIVAGVVTGRLVFPKPAARNPDNHVSS